MAKYSWDKAELEDYKTTLTALSRQSIADGNLLNKNIEAFEDRDNYVNDKIDPISNVLDKDIEVISEYSAKNWNNNLLTGFNAISADTAVMKMTKCNDGPVTLQFNGMSAEVDKNDSIVLSIPSYYSSSYMLCASATLNPVGDHDIQRYDGNNMPNTVFGSDNVLTNYPGLSINASKTNGASIAVNNSIANYGIAINDSENTAHNCPGISINNSSASLLNFAINNSVIDQSNTDIVYFQFAANNAKVEQYGFALNGVAQNYSIAIGTDTNICDFHSLAYKDSIANTYSVGLFDSSAYYNSIALYDSSARFSAVSLFDSSANYNSFAVYNSRTLANDTIGHNIAAYNSDASGMSIGLYNSHARDCSLAIFNSVAINDCFAFNNSTATYAGSLTLMSSTGASIDTFAFCKSVASNSHSIVFNSQYSDEYGISFADSVGAHPQAISLFNTTAVGIKASKSFDAYSVTFNTPTVRNISGYNDSNIALYNSTIGYTTDYFPANVFTGYSCGSVPAGSAISGKYHIERTMTKYDSFNAGNDSVSYYSSIVGVGVSAALAMYDSIIKTDAMILTPDGQDSIFTSLVSGNIAMYNSTVTSGDNAIVLWNNKVRIEERGSVNDTIFIDMNIKSNVSKPDYSVLNSTSTDNDDSTYYAGKHIFIIA